jgi:hypothetical protein
LALNISRISGTDIGIIALNNLRFCTVAMVA